MKLLTKNNHHVKTIPRRYKDVLPDVGDYLMDLEHKRLSKQERATIEMEVFKRTLPPVVQELIGTKEATHASLVIVKNSESYYSVNFGSIEVRCPREVYKMVKDKRMIRRS